MKISVSAISSEVQLFQLRLILLKEMSCTNAQSVRHFYIVKGSCAEVITFLVLDEDIGYLERDIVPSLIEEYRHVSHMLYKLIETRHSPQTKKP